MNRRTFTQHLGFIAVCLVFAGCSLVPPAIQQPTPVNTLSQHHPLDDNHWAFKAKLAISVQNKRTSVFLNWEQRGTASNLILSGPIGRGLTKIKSDAQGNVQVISARRTRQYPSLDQAILDELGWDFPASLAQFWVTGRPDPNHWYREDAEHAGVDAWIQSDWRVVIEQTTLLNQTHTAPQKIQFTYPALTETPDIKISLVIKSWDADLE